MGCHTDAWKYLGARSLAAAATALSLVLLPAHAAAAEDEADATEAAEKDLTAEEDVATDEPDATDADASDAATEAGDGGDSSSGDPAMVSVGIGLLGVGTFGVIVGIVGVVGGSSIGNEYECVTADCVTLPPTQPATSSPRFAETTEPGLQIAGGIMLGIGGAMLITGAILIPVGATREPTKEGADQPALIIEPLVGPTSGGVRLRF